MDLKPKNYDLTYTIAFFMQNTYPFYAKYVNYFKKPKKTL